MPKILIVDDSWTDLTVLAMPFREQGYEVITATDGDEAIRTALAEQPDCILLDVVLPKQNGFQVCRYLKQSEASRHIPIIMVTIKKTPTDIRWGLQQGADLYLTKPVRPDAILASVQSVL
jgi:twitching motility two-component system response regulator PilH